MLGAKEKLLDKKQDELQKQTTSYAEEKAKLQAEMDAQMQRLQAQAKDELMTEQKKREEVLASALNDERLLASTLFEMGNFLNSLTRERKRESSPHETLSTYTALKHPNLLPAAFTQLPDPQHGGLRIPK